MLRKSDYSSSMLLDIMFTILEILYNNQNLVDHFDHREGTVTPEHILQE